MSLLHNGGTAVEAVEMAIKVLEDKEITNAGFGSNLTLEGTVECDATVVDHFGRSGAVGAVGRQYLRDEKALVFTDRCRYIQSYFAGITGTQILIKTPVSPPSPSKFARGKGCHGLRLRNWNTRLA